MKNKTLSSKRERNTCVGGPDLGNIYWEDDVREFISDLKKIGCKKGAVYNDDIDKLAGDKLK